MTGMSHHITTLCRLSLIGLLYLSLQVAPVANALPIDDFSQAAITSITSPADGSLIILTDPGLNVLGGSRTTAIFTESQAVPGFDTATVSYFAGGQLSFMDDNSSAGWSGAVGLGYDLTTVPLPSEDVGVEIDLLAYDGPAGEFLFVAALLDDVAGVPVAATAGPQTLQVLFPVGVSPSDNLTIVFQVPAGGDFRVDTIRTYVPESSTVLLAGLGLAGLALAGRKR